MFSLFILAAVATCCLAQFVSDHPVDGIDCEDILDRSGGDDGLYWVSLSRNDNQAMSVLCDMRGDGWTVIFNRYDGSVDFNRNWQQMQVLVGDLQGEFWLGLEPIHRLTTSGQYTLMVEGLHYPNHNWTEIYNKFYLSGEDQKYKLAAHYFDSKQSTNTFNSLGHENDKPFATYDNDTSGYPGNCAVRAKGPGWFLSDCDPVVLPFSPYRPDAPPEVYKLRWFVEGRSHNAPLRLSMKIRRTRF